MACIRCHKIFKTTRVAAERPEKLSGICPFNGSFISWEDFDLWNAWLRVFGLGTFLAEFHLMNAMSDYSRTGDRSHLKGPIKNPIFCEFEDPDYKEFFEASVETAEAVEAGTLDAKEAANRIFELADSYAFPVPIHKDALVRCALG